MGYLPGYATPRIVCDVPFVGKRWVHMLTEYDRERGISYWTKNYRTSIEPADLRGAQQALRLLRPDRHPARVRPAVVGRPPQRLTRTTVARHPSRCRATAFPHPAPTHLRRALTSESMSPTDPETAQRVTTVEVFFDVVFVFTITQLAGVLEDHLTWAGFGITVLVLGVLWYPYTGYAWLTNQRPPRRPAQKIPLFAGMAGFLLTSVAIPAAFSDTALLFALGYLVLTGVHLIMFSGSAAHAAALRLTPYNLGAALLILLAAFVSGPATYGLWIAAALVQAALPYLTPGHSWIRVAGSFRVAAGHLVERHGLLVIVALGESVVAIGAGVDIHHVTPGHRRRDRHGTRPARCPLVDVFHGHPHRRRHPRRRRPARPHPPRRPHLRPPALPAALGVIATAAGIHAVVAHPDAPASTPAALVLAGGVALYLTGVAAARLALGLGLPLSRAAGAAAVLATVVLGIRTVAGAQARHRHRGAHRHAAGRHPSPRTAT